jgi:hypothetical protein
MRVKDIKVGARVWWEDPDGGACSRFATVSEIRRRRRTFVLKDGDWDCEVYAEEIHHPSRVWSYEFTDTFGGEANYSWVRRGIVIASTRRSAITAAKHAAGYHGRHRTAWYSGSDESRIDLCGCCICGFISLKEDY